MKNLRPEMAFSTFPTYLYVYAQYHWEILRTMVIFADKLIPLKVTLMKKHLSLVLTLALLMAVSFGCKVGADDPGLTFASRDGRLIATWNLTAVDWKTTDIFAGLGTFTETTTYDGSILTVVSSPGGSNTFSYTLQVVIEKDGALTVTETVDGNVTTENDYWQWLNADKNKSSVILNSGSMAGGIWTVRRLTGSELVLERNVKEVEVNNGDTDSHEEVGTFTFEAE
jgi:hypothetical protein